MKITILGILSASVTLVACASHPSYQCNSSIQETTPTSRFNVNRADGVVFDEETKLIWKICAEGQRYSRGHCAGVASEITWDEAMQKYENKVDSWRLPSTEELQGLVEEQCKSPAINTAVFPNTPSSPFWSASQDEKNPAKARYLNFFHGRSYSANKSAKYNLRLVRGEGARVLEEQRELVSELMAQSRIEELLKKEKEAESNAFARCSNKASCNRLFALTKTYINSESDKEIKVATDNVIETYDPVEVGSIGMIARMISGEATSAEIRLSVSCMIFGSEILIENLKSETESSEALREKMIESKIACLSKKISTYQSFHSFINERYSE